MLLTFTLNPTEISKLIETSVEVLSFLNNEFNIVDIWAIEFQGLEKVLGLFR